MCSSPFIFLWGDRRGRETANRHGNRFSGKVFDSYHTRPKRGRGYRERDPYAPAKGICHNWEAARTKQTGMAPHRHCGGHGAHAHYFSHEKQRILEVVRPFGCNSPARRPFRIAKKALLAIANYLAESARAPHSLPRCVRI